MILISRTAAERVFAEVQRWVEHGLGQDGHPLESLLYPLSAMVPARGVLSPVELVCLDDIRELVIDQVAIPPDGVKDFSPGNCHFSAEDMDRANREFNASIDAQIEASPRLAVLSKLHSHPFARGAFLSQGDLFHGVASPEAVAWRESRGLATSLLHVVYPDDHPVTSARPWRITSHGAVCSKPGSKVVWRIHTWGSSGGHEMVDQGDALVVSDRHPSVRACRRPPYWATLAGSRWCDGQKQALREAGYAVSRNLLGRGWRRYIVQTTAGQLLLALPPDFPATPLRPIRVIDARNNLFEVLPPSGNGSQPISLASISLLEVVRRLGGVPS